MLLLINLLLSPIILWISCFSSFSNIKFACLCIVTLVFLTIHSRIFVLPGTWSFLLRPFPWTYHSLPACTVNHSKCIHLDSTYFQLQMLKPYLFVAWFLLYILFHCVEHIETYLHILLHAISTYCPNVLHTWMLFW